MSKDIMNKLLRNLQQHPEDTIAKCAGAENMTARLFRRILVNANITNANTWDAFMRSYLIDLEEEIDLKNGIEPKPRTVPTNDKLRSEATNLRSMLIGTSFSFEVFIKAMRLIGGMAFTLNLKAKRPVHPLIPPGEDIEAQIAVYTREIDQQQHSDLEHFELLQHLFSQVRYQMGLEDDDAFHALIDLKAKEDAEASATDGRIVHISSRNNNRKHLHSEKLTWAMTMRGLATLRLEEVQFKVNLIRPRYQDVEAIETINLSKPAVQLPPPPPAKPTMLSIDDAFRTQWLKRK